MTISPPSETPEEESFAIVPASIPHHADPTRRNPAAIRGDDARAGEMPARPRRKGSAMLRRLCLLLLCCLPLLRAQPFFAMDNGLPGDARDAAAAAVLLDELGYDGLGGRGSAAKPQREAMAARGLRLWNVYLTLEFEPGKPALTPEIRTMIDGLKGHEAMLWIAIMKVGGDEDATAVAALREIADHATPAGVGISLYPHTAFWLERFDHAARLAATVDRETVGITFNLCHWLKVEGDVDPLPAIVRHRSRLQFVTVNGADRGDTRAMGWDRLIRPLGEGSYDVGGLLRRLHLEGKWRGPVGLQSYGVAGDRRANLAKSIAAWRRMQGLLDGTVLCGYQGWFRCEGDGAGNGWHHYAVNGRFEPGHAHIEMWPDMTEAGPTERFATPFRHADGAVAEVFSSVHGDTVRRHFRWMREHGIDGVFLQRFATSARDPRFRGPMDRVLAHCRDSAAAEGRRWALMYDLSGLKAADYGTVEEDWRRVKSMLEMPGPSYLSHRHRPLVALWGLGFHDRPPALAEWERLIGFFRSEGCAIMLGVPCYWRTLDRDCIADPALHRLIEKADIVSPWAVGRFGTPEDAAARVETLLLPDRAWCRERGIDYLPVVFPGFSWQNLQKSRGTAAEFDAIPRQGGRFLWSQARAARAAGNRALYVAMFDEMDEATAIFKTTSKPPVGASRFLAEPDLPSDHYLWLTGEIGRMLRGEVPVGEMPARRK
jgi:sugar phosphate isomerase/epimerase